MRDLVATIAMVLVLGPVASWAFALTPLGRELVERMKDRTPGSDEVCFGPAGMK